MIYEDRDLRDQTLDQCLVKLRDRGELALDEILQVLDQAHLLVLDDAVHLGLPALIPESKNLICDGIVIIFLVDLLQELPLQLVQAFVYDSSL